MTIDKYKTLFTEAVHQHVEVIGVSSAVSRPRPPVFVSLPQSASTWKSLTQIIPMVLTYGIIGYPFVMPGPVGGDFFTEDAYTNYTHMYLKSLENALFEKSIQPTFAPVINKTKQEENVTSDVFPEHVNESENETMETSPPDHSFNIDELFHKDLSAADAENILRNISSANLTDVLDKANKDFAGNFFYEISWEIVYQFLTAGEAMVGDQAYELRFLPDKELYIRWLQLATFLPVIRFTYLPSKYKDESVLEMAKVLTSLRVKIVSFLKFFPEGLLTFRDI